mmetsp:Transcript_2098/g.4827  ORF Transcript_2098/g.4827 Transcript_2098/m.4827 type:complete len:87 (+) Transcript_2098:292-552(+)
MRIKVLYFASAREATHKTEEEFHFGEDGGKQTTRELMQALVTAYPGLKALADTLVLAVNMNYVDKDADVELSSTDEVAIIPPIGGG